MMRFSWLAVLAGICLPFALGSAALADHHGGGNKQTVSGTVTSVDATSSSFVVQVEGGRHQSSTSVTIDTGASTIFRKVTGHQTVAATFADLGVGEQVQAQGAGNTDGSVAAAKVTIRVPVAEVRGAVASVTGDTFVVTPSGPQGAALITVHTSASTQFLKNDHSAASLSDVAVGVPVEAEGTLNADGSIQALVVVLDLIKHYEGAISALDSGTQSFTLHGSAGGVTVDVTANTKIRKFTSNSAAGTSATFADLAVGDRVAVDGSVNADSSVTATQVLDAGQPKVAFAGSVASLTADGFVVTLKSEHASTTSVTVHTNASTQFTRSDHSAATLSDVVVGATVQVAGTQNADGSVAAGAVVIVIVQQHDSGIITATDGGSQSFTLHPSSGADITVDVTANTVIRKVRTPSAARTSHASFSDLQVGDAVNVDGTLNADGSVTAGQVLDTGAPRVAGTGTVARLTADGFVLTVKSDHSTTTQVTVHTDASTTFVKGDNIPATLADVTVGATVTLIGTRNVDGSVHAAIVDIALPRPVVSGKVANVSASGFTVTQEHHGDVSVTVTGTTTYHNADGSTAQFSDVTAGVAVAVRGTVNMDGSVTATDVVIYPAHDH